LFAQGKSLLPTPQPKPLPVRSPGRPRDKTREAKILEETLQLLGEVGFARLTVDAVVARARASKATVYRRWATKEELAVAAFDLLPLIEIESCGDLEEDILRYIEQYSRFMQTTTLRSVLPALVSEACQNPVLAEKLQQTVMRRRESGIVLVEAAIARGELSASTDPVLAQELFIGPLVNRTFFFPENFDLADFRTLARIVVAGLKAQSAPV